MINSYKKVLKSLLKGFNKWILDLSIERKDFCIFSNDCWGAELYRHMKLPYNTPFVGLMLMAPCYIKFLKDPHKYLDSELEFINESGYPLINKLRNDIGKFPIGKISDIEIQFQHYDSEEEAREKWNRRKERINWDNIFVKFTMDKDYSTDDHLSEFESLPYTRKVCFSKLVYTNSTSCITVGNSIVNGAKLFRLCMKQFDLIGWMNYGRIHFISWQKLRGILLYHLLHR